MRKKLNDIRIVRIGKFRKIAVLILQSTKAKKLFFKANHQSCRPEIIYSKDIHKILVWAITNNLTMSSDLSIIIPSKKIKS